MKHWTKIEFDKVYDYFTKIGTRSKRTHDGRTRYYNDVLTFDTETTSTIQNDIKLGYCYIWQICIAGVCYYGRYLEEFRELLHRLSEVLTLSDERRILIYVHNLDFDFQFIRKYFTFSDVFARSERKPIYAVTDNGIEFRCSYLLTGLSLAKLPEQIPGYDLKKMVGDLDYSKIRHSETVLTAAEMLYCERDVKILYDYMQTEKQKNRNNVAKIPLTQTGYVRRECKKRLSKNKNQWFTYLNRIKNAYPTTELYTLLVKAYQGGYTHANALYTGVVLDNVKSIDFASSYPSVMVCKKFPWKFRKIDIQSKTMFYRLIKRYACVFEIGFYNIRARTSTTTISTSKCEFVDNVRSDNGRVYTADFILTYMTELDFATTLEFYEFDEFEIGLFYYAKYETLPREIIEVVLKAYENKTALKGIEGKEDEYAAAKRLINGIYGMTVTAPVSDTISYVNDEWSSTPPDMTTALLDDMDKAYLLYQWGVWVAAHARRNLLHTVYQLGDAVVYCDTDSIKYIDNGAVDNIVNDYNDKQRSIICGISARYGYNIPKSPDGISRYLGVFEPDGVYTQFKTLGAKRYIAIEDGKFKITIAGLNKKIGAAYIEQHGAFDFFNDNMTIPAGDTGKKEHSYIDDEMTFTLTDEEGITETVTAPSAVCLVDIPFSMGLSNEYLDLFTKIQLTSLGLEVGQQPIPELSIGATRFVKRTRGDFNG